MTKTHTRLGPAGTDTVAVDDLRSGRPGLRLRHLRTADAAAHHPACPRRVARRRTQQPCRQLLGREPMRYAARRGRRHLRAAGRLPDGSSSGGGASWSGASCSMPSPPWRRGSRPRSSGCSSGGAAPSSASASSSSLRSPGCPSCSPIRCSASGSSDTPRHSAPSAD